MLIFSIPIFFPQESSSSVDKSPDVNSCRQNPPDPDSQLPSFMFIWITSSPLCNASPLHHLLTCSTYIFLFVQEIICHRKTVTSILTLQLLVWMYACLNCMLESKKGGWLLRFLMWACYLRCLCFYIAV